MTASPIQDEFATWRLAIGRQIVQEQRLEQEPLRRYAVAIGCEPDIERRLPPLAHWAFFLPLTNDARIGDDGHPLRGDFLPAISVARRMFASARIEFLTKMALGRSARLTSTIVGLELKTGSSGPLIFAIVERVLSQNGIDRVRETQTYVYRDAGDPLPLPVIADPTPPGECWQPDTVNLFRFSATTFNAHRIHYDLPYATRVEGYPALVVHGPFTAAKLAGLAEREGALSQFAFRAQVPLFAGQPVWLQRKTDQAIAVRCDGAIAMTAQVSYA